VAQSIWTDYPTIGERAVKTSVLITHRLPLSELSRGIELMRASEAMKVLVEV
jgi:threonine dehydrogenase-like Zn-dependent dehydrogenase